MLIAFVTKRGYNSIIDTLGNHDVPQGWIQTPRPNTTPNTNPGPPVSWNDPSNPDDPQAGYGYIPNDTTKEETFFYHSDHLGSTSYITDDKGNITQYDAYLPYGELLVDEHSSSEDLPYKFNGKQFDEETGLYYYGARYMKPMASIWYGVDPLAEKYNNVSPFVFCKDNPIGFIDPDGKKVYQGNLLVIYLVNGQLTLSSKANEYTRALYDGMIKTATGKRHLSMMVRSNTNIYLRYSSENTNTKRDITYARTLQAKKDGSSIRYNKEIYSSTWAQITFYVETIKQSTTIKGLENYGLSFSEAMGAEGVHESVHAADPAEVNRDIRSSQPGQKNLSEFIYERKARLMEAKFREELKKNKDNQNEKRKL